MRVRIDRARKVMRRGRVNSLVITGGPNFTYLTGGLVIECYERPIMLVIGEDSTPLIIAPELERDRLNLLEGAEKLYYGDSDDPFELLKSASLGSRVGIDPSISLSLYKRLRKTLKGKRLVDVGSAFREERMVKDSDELKSIEEGVRIIEELVRMLEKKIEPGVTEVELSYLLRMRAEEIGAENTVFAAVQSGPNSSIPHHERSPRILRKGDVIVVDIVVRTRGYHADLTRVYCIGEAPPGFKRVFEAVKEARERAIGKIRPGIPAHEIDMEARKTLAEKGLAEHFIHRTGHGIGVEVHEPPYISSSSKTVLEPGMTFTVEPGVYIAGKYGARIESDIVVEEDGCRVLDKFTSELIIV